jgi:hypothetical protein
MKRCAMKHIKERNNQWAWWLHEIVGEIGEPLYRMRVNMHQHKDQIDDIEALMAIYEVRRVVNIARKEGRVWLFKQYRKADLADGYTDEGLEEERAFPKVSEVTKMSYFVLIKKLEELNLHFLSKPWGIYNPPGHGLLVQKYIEKMKSIPEPLDLLGLFDTCIQ